MGVDSFHVLLRDLFIGDVGVFLAEDGVLSVLFALVAVGVEVGVVVGLPVELDVVFELVDCLLVGGVRLRAYTRRRWMLLPFQSLSGATSIIFITHSITSNHHHPIPTTFTLSNCYSAP